MTVHLCRAIAIKQLQRAGLILIVGCSTAIGQDLPTSPSAADVLRKLDATYGGLPPRAMHVEAETRYSGDSPSSRVLGEYVVSDERQDGERIDLQWTNYVITRKGKEPAYTKRGIWTGKQFQFRQQQVVDTTREPPAQIQPSVSTDSGEAQGMLTYTGGGAHLQGIFPGDVVSVVQVAQEQDAQTRLRADTEEVAGSPCYVLECDSKRGHYVLWVDPAQGYAIAKATVDKSAGNLWYDESLEAAPAKGQDLVSVHAELSETTVQKIGDTFVPVSGKLVVEEVHGDGTHRTSSYVATRSNIQLNPDFSSMTAFVMDGIPDGTVVWNEDFPGLPWVWMNGAAVADTGTDVVKSINKVIANERQSLSGTETPPPPVKGDSVSVPRPSRPSPPALGGGPSALAFLGIAAGAGCLLFIAVFAFRRIRKGTP